MFDRELQCTCLREPQSVTTREVMEGANSQNSVSTVTKKKRMSVKIMKNFTIWERRCKKREQKRKNWSTDNENNSVRRDPIYEKKLWPMQPYIRVTKGNQSYMIFQSKTIETHLYPCEICEFTSICREDMTAHIDTHNYHLPL